MNQGCILDDCPPIRAEEGGLSLKLGAARQERMIKGVGKLIVKPCRLNWSVGGRWASGAGQNNTNSS